MSNSFLPLLDGTPVSVFNSPTMKEIAPGAMPVGDGMLKAQRQVNQNLIFEKLMAKYGVWEMNSYLRMKATQLELEQFLKHATCQGYTNGCVSLLAKESLERDDAVLKLLKERFSSGNILKGNPFCEPLSAAMISNSNNNSSSDSPTKNNTGNLIEDDRDADLKSIKDDVDKDIVTSLDKLLTITNSELEVMGMKSPKPFATKAQASHMVAYAHKVARKRQRPPSIDERSGREAKRPILHCKCTKSECLKLYCKCFIAQKACSKACMCTGCENFEGSIKRQEAVDRILVIRPDAFSAPVKCKCKRSKCQKLYCDCFQAGRACSDQCECQGCHNL